MKGILTLVLQLLLGRRLGIKLSLLSLLKVLLLASGVSKFVEELQEVIIIEHFIKAGGEDVDEV